MSIEKPIVLRHIAIFPFFIQLIMLPVFVVFAAILPAVFLRTGVYAALSVSSEHKKDCADHAESGP